MIYRLIHIILAFSVFLSSAGFWTNNHYCQNEQTGSSIFVILGSCCSSESAPCSEEKTSCGVEDHTDKCCDNKSEFHKLDQDQLLTITEFKSFEEYESFKYFLHSNERHHPIVNRHNYKHYKYVPPLIVFDYQVRLQTFLC